MLTVVYHPTHMQALNLPAYVYTTQSLTHEPWRWRVLPGLEGIIRKTSVKGRVHLVRIVPGQRLGSLRCFLGVRNHGIETLLELLALGTWGGCRRGTGVDARIVLFMGLRGLG